MPCKSSRKVSTMNHSLRQFVTIKPSLDSIMTRLIHVSHGATRSFCWYNLHSNSQSIAQCIRCCRRRGRRCLRKLSINALQSSNAQQMPRQSRVLFAIRSLLTASILFCFFFSAPQSSISSSLRSKPSFRACIITLMRSNTLVSMNKLLKHSEQNRLKDLVYQTHRAPVSKDSECLH